MSFLLIIPGLLLVLGIWGIIIYNALVRQRNLVKEGWSGIDVQLKRRSNLIPNLVDVVKGYMGHERDLLHQVTELRSKATKAGDVAEKGRLEGRLSQSLASILAVAEAYPELKANQNFMDLQDELAGLEEEIQMARRYYNGTVRDLNIKIESFPSNLIAGAFGFIQAAFFQIDDPKDRAVPKVDL